MKRLGVVVVITLTVMLAACGGSSSSPSTTTNPATGAWSETLASSSSLQLGSFTFDMTQNNTALTATGLNLTNMGLLAPCFGAGTVMSGQMGPGMMNGGAVTITISWTSPGGGTNTLTMQGNMAIGMASGSGTFTLAGQTSGCTSQTGTFSMTRSSGMMM